MASSPLQVALRRCSTVLFKSIFLPISALDLYRFCLPHYPVPSVLTILLLVLLWIPVLFTIESTFSHVRRCYAVYRLGARMAPPVRGRLPGNIDVLMRHIELCKIGYADDPIRRLLSLGGEDATVVRIGILWDEEILTNEPEHVKIVLATDFSNYVKGENFRETTASFLGSGVFNSDGDMWKFHRSMTRPFFARDRISDFDIFDRHVERTLELLRSRVVENVAIDFQDLISRFTLDSASSFLFGECVNSLEEDIPYPPNHVLNNSTHASFTDTTISVKDFASAFGAAQVIISDRLRSSGLWPYLESRQDRTKKPMDTVRQFLKPIIDSAVEKERIRKLTEGAIEKTDSKGHESEETAETLLADLARRTNDPIVLQDEVLNILIAARDTTASALTFSMYMLALYPSVHSKLRKEILDQLGTSGRPTLEAIREMKYLRAFINEVLRLYPPVPLNARTSVKEATLPSLDHSSKPYYVPAATTVSYSVWTMHRRKDLWGPDAEEFDPDRWLDERLKKYVASNPFIFLPFNAGPRICLGQQFAYNEISFMLIRLMQAFSSVSLALDAQPPATLPPPEWAMCAGTKGKEKLRPKQHLTLYLYGGLWLKFT